MHPSTQVIDPDEIAVYIHSAVHPVSIARDSVKNGRGIVPLTTTRLLVGRWVLMLNLLDEVAN